MKSRSAFAFLTLLTLVTGIGASAQQQAIQGKIPFDFAVGEKLMPAGEYAVVPGSNHSFEIRSRDGLKWAVVVGSQSYHEAANGSQLEFDRLGESYFLRRVLCRTLAALNVDLPIGKSERAAKERDARLQSEQHVTVAMK